MKGRKILSSACLFDAPVYVKVNALIGCINRVLYCCIDQFFWLLISQARVDGQFRAKTCLILPQKLIKMALVSHFRVKLLNDCCTDGIILVIPCTNAEVFATNFTMVIEVP